MSGYFWGVLGLLVVAATKYLTAIRLRGLTQRMHQEHQDANDLKHVLMEASEKETELRSETGALQSRITALQSAVGNLERSLRQISKDESVSE